MTWLWNPQKAMQAEKHFMDEVMDVLAPSRKKPASSEQTMAEPVKEFDVSLFGNIVKAAHTAVSWFEKNWASFEKNAPTIEAIADHGFKYAVMGLKIVLANVGADTPAGIVLSNVIKNLLTISSVVYDVGAHASLAGELQVVMTDLNSILDETHIKDAGTRASVTKIVQTIAALVEAFMGGAAQAPAA